MGGEVLVLRVDAEHLVVGRDHALSRVSPIGELLRRHSELGAPIRVVLCDLGGDPQIPRGHQVGVDVVVSQRAVLIRAGDAIDPKPAVMVAVPEPGPQPSGLDEQLDARLARKGVVIGGGAIPAHGIGDVGVQVEGGGSGGPVSRALLAADRAPREGRPAQAEQSPALPRER